MKIVEKISSVTDPAIKPTRMIRARGTLPEESEVERLTRQLKRATDRNVAEFDRGFQAATLLVKHGADYDRLVEASGVVAGEYEDTEPVLLPTLLAVPSPTLHVEWTGEYYDEITLVDNKVYVPDNEITY